MGRYAKRTRGSRLDTRVVCHVSGTVTVTSDAFKTVARRMPPHEKCQADARPTIMPHHDHDSSCVHPALEILPHDREHRRLQRVRHDARAEAAGEEADDA
eukprot:98394-Prymnesium_polylepis.1